MRHNKIIFENDSFIIRKYLIVNHLMLFFEAMFSLSKHPVFFKTIISHTCTLGTPPLLHAGQTSHLTSTI